MAFLGNSVTADNKSNYITIFLEILTKSINEIKSSGYFDDYRYWIPALYEKYIVEIKNIAIKGKYLIYGHQIIANKIITSQYRKLWQII